MTEKEVKTSASTKVTADKEENKKSAKADVFAVIKTGGKQYVVSEGRFYEFEKIEGEEGKEVVFEEVLLTADGANVKIGTPTTGTKVTGKILSQFKDDKVVVVKYKPKKRYKKTTGHRQQKTKVEITKIA